MKKALAKKLADWEKAGLVHREQVVAISKYEESLSENHWVLSGLMILGVLTIGIGVISLIASNWSNIPNAAKLIFDFFALGGIGFAIYRASALGRETAFNAWIVAMQIAALASIGLISQIYHTGGELYQAILFWSLLVAPLSFVATKLFPPMLWMGGLLGAMAWAVVDSGIFTTVFSKKIGYVVYSITMFCLMLSVISRLVSRGEEWPMTRAARFWTAFIGTGALFFLEVTGRERSADQFSPMYLGLIFLTVALGGILLGGVYNRFQRLSMMAMLVLFTTVAHLPQFGPMNGFDWISGVALTLATLIAAGLFAASLKAQKTFQYILALIGIRLLAVYFEAVGGLAATGVGLILSGLVVIGMGWLWNKNRKKIQVWVEEFAK
jgi:uncharacterized membrane protein